MLFKTVCKFSKTLQYQQTKIVTFLKFLFEAFQMLYLQPC